MRGKRWVAALPMAALAGAGVLWMGRVRQDREIDVLWRELAHEQPGPAFDVRMVDGLPPPARRYLLHSIAPGTRLTSTVRLSMHGEMRLRPGAELLPMRAEQVLAPPRGFVWRARVGKGMMRFSGFDRYGRGEGRMRWWLYGLAPLVRADGTDVTRSAAGRLAGEGVLVPGALLPRPGVRWTAMDDSSALVQMQVGGETVDLTLVVDGEGRARRVSIRRWRDDAGNGRPGFVRFDVDGFADERTFGGYTIPTRFRAGWRLGEPDEFPFFYATLDSATFGRGP